MIFIKLHVMTPRVLTNNRTFNKNYVEKYSASNLKRPLLWFVANG